ncbi:hypothetical protein [Parvibaculum lavamentivorans]|nr:hypothetical protein [Parvibaculum lavamentivorans]
MGAALAIFAMAACADNIASEETTRDVRLVEGNTAKSAPVSKVAISALTGVPPTEANLFSELLKEEMARTSIPLSGEGGLSFDVTGAMGAGKNPDGTYIVAVIDIGDAGGARLHRVLNEKTIPGGKPSEDPWNAVGNNTLRSFAAATAQKIASWYSQAAGPGATIASRLPAENDSVITGSIGEEKAEARLPFDIALGPTPGDGNAALSGALNGALSRRVPTASWVDAPRYRIEGSVVTASRNDGRTDVSIRWLVKSADGEILGEVLQQNALDAERIAGRWGEVAEMAAEAAADGVLAVLGRTDTSMAANSQDRAPRRDG